MGTEIHKNGNGNEARQDRAIDDLAKDLRRFTKEDKAVHEQLVEGVGELQGDLKAFALVGKVIWGVLFIFLTVLGTLLGYGYNEISHIERKLQEVDSRTQADWANGKRWSQSLDKDVQHLEDAIQELRRHHNGAHGE